jgi:hypothetical protein
MNLSTPSAGFPDTNIAVDNASASIPVRAITLT